MERFSPEPAARLEDCSILDALIRANLKTPITQFLALMDQHAASNCAECAAIAQADQLLELEAEAPCTCHQTDVDLFDSHGCDFHDPHSPWNVRLRAVTSIQQYEQAVA